MKAHEAIAAVAAEVRPVRKGDWNEQGRFHFRGVDAVVNAVAPVLDAHGVVIVPVVQSYETGTVEVGKNKTVMRHAQVTIEFRWYGPEGDFIASVTAGEAMDSGDKATSKAHSVAYRTSILQVLHLPTDEKDPDAAEGDKDARELKAATDTVLRAAQSAGHDGKWAATNFYEWSQGGDIREADAKTLRDYAAAIEPKTTVQRGARES